MIRTFLFLLCLTPSLAFAQTAPRLTQVTPHPHLPEDKPIIQDLDGDALADIIFLSPRNGNSPVPGNGIVIRNLGMRSFGSPKFSIYQETISRDKDSNLSLIKINGPSDYRLFFNYLKDGGIVWPGQVDAVSTPMTVGFDKPGTFGVRFPLYTQATSPWFPANLDNDDCTEFLQNDYAQGGPNEFRIWERQPNGSYLPQVVQLNDSFSVYESTLIDLDGDGDLDILDRNQTAAVERIGNRTFAPTVYSISSISQDALFDDLNGDSLPDAYTFANGILEWKINLGNFTFGSTQQRYLEKPSSYGTNLFYIEKQPSAPSVLSLTSTENYNMCVYKVRFGTWEAVSESIIVFNNSYQLRLVIDNPKGVAFHDFDNDTFPDLLIHGTQSTSTPVYSSVNRLAIAWGSSVGFGSAEFINPAPISSRITLVNDFDRDLDTDLILGPDLDGYIWFLPNEGNCTFPNQVRLTEISPPISAPSGTVISGIVAGDLNGDSIQDLVVSYQIQYFSWIQSADGIAYGRGDGSFFPPVLNSGAFGTVVSSSVGIDKLIDWDRDGDLDVIGGASWRENVGGTISQEARPIAESAISYDALGNPFANTKNLVGDLDGNGAPDMLMLVKTILSPFTPNSPISFPTSTIGISYNDGAGSITAIAEANASTFITDALGNTETPSAALADLNMDGNLDIVLEEYNGIDALGNPLSTVKWWRNPGGGSRNPATWLKFPLGSKVIPSGPMLDFDGDGRLEWVDSSGYIRPTSIGPAISPVYILTRGVNFSSATTSHAADFDGDGDADFLISDSKYNFYLIHNPLVEERSAITRYLVAASVQPNRAGPHLDADGDGRDNQTELIFGTNPLLADRAPVNPLAMSLGESLTFQVPTYAAALNLEYEVEASTNLVHWTKFQVSPAVTLQTNAGWNSLSSAVDRSGPCGYFRVKAWHRLDQP